MKRRTFLRHLLTAGAAAALGALPRQLTGPATVIDDDSWPDRLWRSVDTLTLVPSGTARTITLPAWDGTPIIIGHPDGEAPTVILNGWQLDHEKTVGDASYYVRP